MDSINESQRWLLTSRIEQAQFAETRIRPGYVKDDVDQFLRDVRDSLEGRRTPPLTAADIRFAVFRTTRLKPGYDEGQVDALLEELERALS